MENPPVAADVASVRTHVAVAPGLIHIRPIIRTVQDKVPSLKDKAGPPVKRPAAQLLSMLHPPPLLGGYQRLMIQATTPHKRRTWQLDLAAFWNFLFQRGFRPLSRPVRIPGRHFAALWSTPLIPDEPPSFQGQVERGAPHRKRCKACLVRCASVRPPVDSDTVPECKAMIQRRKQDCDGQKKKKNPPVF